MKFIQKVLAAMLAVAFSFGMYLPFANAVDAKISNEIFDGCWTITSKLGEAFRLDVAGGVNGANPANKTNIQIWKANDEGAQKFYITRVNSGWYSIRHFNTRKAIDVTDGKRGQGVNVQLYDWNGTDSQLWRFYDAGENYYYIQNKLGYYLDVQDRNASNGGNVQVWGLHGGDNQKWMFDSIENWGIYTITPDLDHSKRLDIEGGGSYNGTNIQIWTANNSIAQMFHVARIDPEWVSIRSVNSGKALDVCNGQSGNCVNVQLYDWNGSDAQRWKLGNSGSEYCYIYNKLGSVLDVSGGNTSDGTNVWMYELNGTGSQKWKFESADLTNIINETLRKSIFRDRVIIRNMELYGTIPEGYDYIKTIADFDLANSEIFYYTVPFPLRGLVRDVGYEFVQKLMRDVGYKFGYLYYNFNHHAKYDVKRKNCWESLFTNIFYPGRDCKFLYEGLSITPEDFGNVLYGYAGSVLLSEVDYSDIFLFVGGGYAATKRFNFNPLEYYGDDKKDHDYIVQGIKISGRNPTFNEKDITKCKILIFWFEHVITNLSI